MKKFMTIFCLLSGLAIFFNSCQPVVDIEKETEAIKAVITEETEAFLNRDYELMASYWVQDESTFRMHAAKSDYSVFYGWEDLSALAMETIENEDYWTTREDMESEKSDFNITVYPDCAWATYIEKGSGTFQGEPYENESIHLIVLHKIEGQWKIASFASIGKTGYEEVEAEEDIEDDLAGEPEEEGEEEE